MKEDKKRITDKSSIFASYKEPNKIKRAGGGK